jgi:flagellar basal-body rod modification protein FlgD
MTSSVSNSSVISNDLMAAVNPKATTTDDTSVEAQQNKFLTLLSTQLQNQDPLNPMDNSQLTSQLAQLSTVTGINQLNTTVTALQTSLQSSQSVQAANLIGRNVLTPGTNLQLVATAATATTPASSAAIGGVSTVSAADDVSVSIKDAKGKVVKTIDYGAQPANAFIPVAWDGTPDAVNGVTPAALAAGTYTISVTATAGGAALTDAKALTLGTVATVSTSATSGTVLTLGNGSQVKYSDVNQIL